MELFLSNEKTLKPDNKISSIWTRARVASGHLKIKWSITDRKHITIMSTQRGTVVNDHRKIFSALREDRRQWHSEKMASHPDQGKTFHCYKKCPESNSFIRDGKYTRFADWRFIHGAWLNLKSLNATKKSKNGHNVMCRHCGKYPETLLHVINHCGPMLKEIRAQHDLIVKRLKDAGKYKNRWAVYAENQPLGSERLRPDLVLIRNNEAIVMDVACPFENGSDALDKARSDNEKYAKLCRELKAKFKRVSLSAIVVGSLGSWDPANDRILIF